MTRSGSTTAGVSQATEVAAQYFAYIAVIGVAAAIAVVAMMFSAQTALHFVDAAAFPNRAPVVQTRQLKPTVPAEQDAGAAKATFAMLPSAMPAKIKNDVMSSNF